MTSRLTTPTQTVQKLQTSLQAKAKAEPAFRFHALWDKVCRADIIAEAYGRCRANDGAPGVDGITFDRIEAEGLDRWLEMLGQELKGGSYRPQPLLRVWIPKSNGARRPLGTPTIRDRTVMMAVVLVTLAVRHTPWWDRRPFTDGGGSYEFSRSVFSTVLES